MSHRDFDVLVVGQGVVGGIVALFLAQRGHRVLAVERHAEPYALPRAVHYDPDVNRFLSGLGIGAAEQASFSEPALSYDWLNAQRQLLLTFPSPLDGSQGWPDSTMFAQPDLEAAIRRHQEPQPNLEVRWGTVLAAVTQDPDGVDATLEGPDGTSTVRAAFVVGCDGANSTVRELLGLEQVDLDFSSDWLVLDLKMSPREWIPVNGQICDPMRPTSCVSGGPGRRRFEFMLMPDDDVSTFATAANAWRLVEPWNVDPSNAQLERLAMYNFGARCVSRWSVGRVFIAGDAAHQMPPFFGRGMVSGVRDAANLSWKLDHVLRSTAPLALLDTYGSERFVHLQHALGMSVELGRIICETDPVKVAERDRHLLDTGPFPEDALPAMPQEILGPGFFPKGTPGDDPVAGRLGEQYPMRGLDGDVALLDSVSFGEFLVLVDMRRLGANDAETIRSSKPVGIEAKVVEVVPEGIPLPNRHSGNDVTGRYGEWFDRIGRAVIVTRPDFYGFGSASTPSGAEALVAAIDPFVVCAGETAIRLTRSTT